MTRVFSATCLTTCLAASLATSAPAASFDIVLDILPAGQTENNLAAAGDTTTVAFSARQEAMLEAAAEFWEGVITGFTGIASPVMTVTTYLAPTGDGFGGTLAVAGPFASGLESSGGFLRATTGVMHFDSDDYGPRSEQNFLDTAVHELAHTLGFGILFNANNLTEATDPTRYIGSEALAAFNAENSAAETFIQLNSDGGHWDECYVRGLTESCSSTPGNANFFNSPDLMTPFASFGAANLSDATVGAFRDMGYVTAANANFVLPTVESVFAPAPPVPLPAGGWLLLGGLAGFAALRRRQTATCG